MKARSYSQANNFTASGDDLLQVQAVPLMSQLLWIQAPVAMVRPWPVDFLNNAVKIINNYMNPWTGMDWECKPCYCAVFYIYVKILCSPLDQVSGMAPILIIY